MISLGIDTSNYTTSVSIYDGQSYKLSRKILNVKEGMRGIRQSDGVFIHNKELPDILKTILNGDTKPDVIGVSTTPRNIEGSYMPVFTVGHGYAKAISCALGIKLYEFSHQDGHIMAGIHSADAYSLLNKPFISVHISGGTTEILRTEYDEYKFKNEIIGGTLDISIGQLIDRIGVKMGLKFPCGKEMDELSKSSKNTVKMPFSVKGSYFNLSGIETKILNTIDGIDCDTIKSVFDYSKDILIKTLANAQKETRINDILLVGGVASNSIIRNGLTQNFGENIHFASKELSSDNSVGIAILAYMAERMNS